MGSEVCGGTEQGVSSKVEGVGGSRMPEELILRCGAAGKLVWLFFASAVVLVVCEFVCIDLSEQHSSVPAAASSQSMAYIAGVS